MGKMVNGTWHTDWYEPDEEGRFKRPDTQFRGRVCRDGSTPHPPKEGRYHLYVSLACPWAHRTLIARCLLGLTDAIDVSIVHPFMGDDGWHFDPSLPHCTPDRVQGKSFLREVYASADPDYTGRVTVPVLWDKKLATIVNNESKEIVRMLDREFVEPGSRSVELFPDAIADDVWAAIDAIYEPINNGVYRSGFATTQRAYEEAVRELFDALDHWDAVLGEQRWLCGSRFTAADIFMFTTLFRFDIVYTTHFKCNVRQVRDYPNLWNFAKEIYQMPGIAETCSVEHAKQHYFTSHPTINPKRIVPVGPDIDYASPHDRGRLG